MDHEEHLEATFSLNINSQYLVKKHRSHHNDVPIPQASLLRCNRQMLLKPLGNRLQDSGGVQWCISELLRKIKPEIILEK